MDSKSMTRKLIILVAAVLGISAGASLAEVTLLVPFWQELEPVEFYDWYAQNHARLVAFYSPLQITSAVAALIASLWLFVSNQRGKWTMVLALIAAVAVLILFPVYFKAANAAFLERSIAPEQLPAALVEWAQWQWARIVLAGIAFLAAMFAIPDRVN